MKKLLKNPWILGIGTTVIGGLMLTLVLDLLRGVDWLNTFKIVIKFIFHIVTAFLNFELKVWWILMAVAVIVLILFFIAKYYDAKSQNEQPIFLSYTTDSVLGYTWEWEYFKGYDGKYTIKNLHPICSKCGMILKQGGMYGLQMECLRCKKAFNWEDSLRTDAQMLIEDNIRKKHLQNQ